MTDVWLTPMDDYWPNADVTGCTGYKDNPCANGGGPVEWALTCEHLVAIDYLCLPCAKEIDAASAAQYGTPRLFGGDP